MWKRKGKGKSARLWTVEAPASLIVELPRRLARLSLSVKLITKDPRRIF